MSETWADITPGARKYIDVWMVRWGRDLVPPLYLAEQHRRYFSTNFSQTWQGYCLVRRYFPAVFVEFRYLVHVES